VSKTQHPRLRSYESETVKAGESLLEGGQVKLAEFHGASSWVEETDRHRECGRWGHCVDEGLIAVCDLCCCMHLKDEGIRPVIGLQAVCRHDWIKYEGLCGACGARKNG